MIGAGGILSGADAAEKFAAGAALVQLYTGLIYRGPALVSRMRIGIPREVKDGELRVALTPAGGCAACASVVVEPGAGHRRRLLR